MIKLIILSMFLLSCINVKTHYIKKEVDVPSKHIIMRGIDIEGNVVIVPIPKGYLNKKRHGKSGTWITVEEWVKIMEKVNKKEKGETL